MPTRYYIVPAVGTGTRSDPRRPSFFADGTSTAGAPYASIFYGFEPWFVVRCNLSAADDADLVGRVNVFALPVDLSLTLTAPQVTNVQAKLEAVNCPSDWVTTALTWQDVLRTVLWTMIFVQRFMGTYAIQTGTNIRIFSGGVTLDTTFGSLTSAVQTALTATATSFGFSTAGLTAGTSLRAILKTMANAFQNAPFNFSGVSI